MDTALPILIVFTMGAFITWWFLLGLLNPFIDAAYAIVKCAVTIIFDFLLKYIFTVTGKFVVAIVKPLSRLTIQINKTLLFILLSLFVFVFDHYFTTKIFAEDEATFHHFVINGTTYWVTEAAMYIGGSFFFIAVMSVYYNVLDGFRRLINRSIRITIVFNR